MLFVNWLRGLCETRRKQRSNRQGWRIAAAHRPIACSIESLEDRTLLTFDPLQPIQLSAPAATITELTPTFAWTAVNDAAGYELWVNDLTTGQVGTIRETALPGDTLSYTPTVPLALGHDYIATVRAFAGDGTNGVWATHHIFTTAAVDTPIANGPTGTFHILRPTFKWSSVVDAASYEVWVNDLTTGESEVIHRTDLPPDETFWIPETDLPAGHKFIWTVRARNAAGEAGGFAMHQVFGIEDPPSISVDAPALLSLQEAANDVQPTFAWSSVVGAGRYDLWVNNLTTGDSGTIRERNLPADMTEFVPAQPLQNGHEYIWTVRAIDNLGLAGEFAPYSVFTVSDVPQPVLSRPLATIATLVPVFDWSDIAGATHYDLWVNDLTTGEVGTIRERNIPGAKSHFAATVPLTRDHDYIWTVRARNATGIVSPWARHERFRIDGVPDNRAPVLDSLGDRFVTPGQELSFRAAAMDADLPNDQLHFTLDIGAPAGATIDPQTGEFHWTVPANPAQSMFAFTIRVTDHLGLDDFETFNVNVSDADDVVLNWNQTLLEAIRLDASPPPIATRNMAMVASAIYDTLNAVEGTPALSVGRPAPVGTSLDAAIASAAHRILTYAYPNQTTLFDAQWSASLSGITDEAAKNDGISVGQEIADAIIAQRTNDGWNRVVDEATGNGPGVWQPTPPMYANPLLPQWADLQPFVMTTVDQFLPAGPPDLSTQEWADAFNDVKSLGRADSVARTADQTEIARFWADGPGTYTPPGHWSAIAVETARTQGLGLRDNARLFAELHLTLADAAIVAWNSKYQYDYWRPEAAMRVADTDGNAATEADLTWTPLVISPNFPEYVSGHSTFSGAAAAILTEVFGNSVGFTTSSYGLPGVTRSFSSFNEAAEEAGRSRIYGGIHFEFSNQDGLNAGRDLANYVHSTFDTTHDTQPPKLILDQSTESIVTSQNLTLTGQVLDIDSGVQSLFVQVDDGDSETVPIDAFGGFSVPTNFALDGSADGPHQYTFDAIDAAGNFSSTTTVTVVVDTAAPTFDIVTPAVGGALQAGSRLTGIVDGTGSTITSLRYLIDDGQQFPMAFDTNTGSFDVPIDLSQLADGPHTISLQSTDAAGNLTVHEIATSLPTLIPLTITEVSPFSGESDVGVTFHPRVHFSRPVNIYTLTSENFYATDAAGQTIPASIVPAEDASFAWLFFDEPLPGATTITLHVEGSSIHALADGALLDADGDGTPGGDLTSSFSTVSLAGIPGTSLVGTIVDPGADLKPATFDDVRVGPDGLLMTADDIFLQRIANVKIYILGFEDQVVFTDAEGHFELHDIPAGHVKLVVDGLTASNAPAGTFYPEMVMDLNIRAGQQNLVMATMEQDPVRQQTLTTWGVYLPRLQNTLLHTASATEPTTVRVAASSAPDLTDHQRQYLTLTVQPNSILGHDGKPLANPQIGISTVPPEMVQPMLPPDLRQQHTFEITIQAPGATVFQTPVEITFPNYTNALPGEKVNIYSFDHTTGLVVLDGTGTVSADGEYVTSDPGSGIRAPGWHFVQVNTVTNGGQANGNFTLVVGGQLGNIIPVHFPNSLLPAGANNNIAGSRDWKFTPGSGGLYFDDQGQRITSEIDLSPSRTVYFLPNILKPSTSPRDPGMASDGQGTFSAQLLNADGSPSNVAYGTLKVAVTQGWVGSVATNFLSSVTPELVAHVQQRLIWLGYKGKTGGDLVMNGSYNNDTIHAIRVFNGAVSEKVDPFYNSLGTNPHAYINEMNAPRWIRFDASTAANVQTGSSDTWMTHWASDYVVALAQSFASLTGGSAILYLSAASPKAGVRDNPKTHLGGMHLDINVEGSRDRGDALNDIYAFYGTRLLADNKRYIIGLESNEVITRSTTTYMRGASTYSSTPVLPGDVAPPNAVPHKIIPESLKHTDATKNSSLNESLNDFYFLQKIAGMFSYDMSATGRYSESLQRQRLDKIRDTVVGVSNDSVRAARVLFNDPGQWRSEAEFKVQYFAGHAGHLHVDLVLKPGTSSPSPAPVAPNSVTTTTGTVPVSTAAGFGTDDRLYYRFQLDNGFEVAGRGRPEDQIRVSLTPNQIYTLTIYQASTNRSSVYVGQSNASGRPTALGTLVLDTFGGQDTDADGIPDLGETAIGTSSTAIDTDRDGINDAAEIEQGLDPLDGRAFPTGIVSTTRPSFSSNAQDLVVDGDTVYVANGANGISVIDVTQIDKPVVLSQLPLGGFSGDVAIDQRLQLLAVATGSTLEIVDVSVPKQPFVRQRVSLSTTRVEILDGIAYATVGQQVVSIDLVSGVVLQTLGLSGGNLTDIVRERDTLFTMDTARNLRAISITAGGMVARGSLNMPVGAKKIFVGGGLAYVVANDFRTNGGYAMADVSNADELTFLGFTPPSDRRPGTSVAANGSGLVLLAGTQVDGTSAATPRVIVLDGSDPTLTDRIVLGIDLPSSPRGIVIANGLAFIAGGTSGVHIVNYLPFDNKGQPPTVSISSTAIDADPATDGMQVVEGSSVRIQALVNDDVQLAKIELLMNGDVVANDVSFPFDLTANAPQLSEGIDRVAFQVRAYDTGGNLGVSNVLDFGLVTDILPPTIHQITPASGSSFLEGQFRAVITFSEPLNAATVNANTLRIVDSTGKEFPVQNIQLRRDDREVQVFHRLGAGAYQLVIDAANVTDRVGNPLGTEPTIVNYTQLGTPPTVTFITPAEGATVEEGILTVRVQFSEPMAAATVNSQTLQLVDGADATLPSLKMLFDSDEVILTYARRPAGDYRIVIDASAVTDLSGNPIGSDAMMTNFVQAGQPPTILSIDPSDGSVLAAGVETVRIRFSEPIHPATLTTQAFQLLDQDSKLVPSRLRLNAAFNVVELQTEPLPAGVYRIRIDGSNITDTSGNRMGDPPIVQDFTLEDMPVPTTPSYDTGSNPVSIAAGDLNNDGILDIVTANHDDDTVTILLGDGAGQLVGRRNLAVGSRPAAVKVVDVNNDGRLDLLAVNRFGNSISVLINLGGGAFAAAVNFAVADVPVDMVTGDFNGDGVLDVATANLIGVNSVQSITVLLGDGLGHFGQRNDRFVPERPDSITTADVNNDGRLDLVTGFNGGVQVQIGTGSGSFLSARVVDIESGRPIDRLELADLNGDGHLDLLAMTDSDRKINILPGAGDGTFGARRDVNVGQVAYARDFAVADLDGDGHVDIVTTNEDSSPSLQADHLSILHGFGNGFFDRRLTFSTSVAGQAMTLADMDGDGDLDVVTANRDASVSLFMNDGSGYLPASAVVETVPDIEPPAVVSIDPQTTPGGFRIVDGGFQSVRITFSEPIDQGVLASAFSITDENNTTIPITGLRWMNLGRTVSLTTDYLNANGSAGSFSTGARYDVRIDETPIVDLAGNSLGSGTFLSSFGITGASPPDPSAIYESNDTLSTAVATGLSSDASGVFYDSAMIGDNQSVSPGRDVDVYKVHLGRSEPILFGPPEMVRLIVDIDAQTAGYSLDAVVQLFDSSGALMESVDDNITLADPNDPYLYFERLGWDVSQTGDYYIVVSGAGNTNYDPMLAGSGSEGSVGLYNIRILVADQHEENDRFDTATTVELNPPDFSDPFGDPSVWTGSMSGFIGDLPDLPFAGFFADPLLDVDIFAIFVGAGDLARIGLRTPNPFEPDKLLRVWDVNGNEIESEDPFGPEFVLTATAESFVYYFGVSGLHNTTYDPNEIQSGYVEPDDVQFFEDQNLGPYELVFRVTQGFSSGPPGTEFLLTSAVPQLATSATTSIEPQDLDAIAVAAGSYWGNPGLIANVTFELADLPGMQLAYADVVRQRILVDRDAAGYGWFVDPTPLTDEEFLEGSAILGSPAENRMDLLTVLTHEMGHILGHDHSDIEGAFGDIMDAILFPSERRPRSM